MRKARSLEVVRRRDINRTALLFSLPAFFFMAMYIAYPIISSFQLSAYDWNGYANAQRVFVGLDNWEALLADKSFWSAFRNNLVVVVLSIVVQLPIGMALGYLLDIGAKKLNAMKVIWFLPYLMSSVAVGLLFKYAFDPYFGVTKLIAPLFGMNSIDLLGSADRALYSVIGVICWQYVPFYMVYFLAGLSSMDTEIYEAAIIDGATRGQFFWRIVLPILSPTIKNACVLSMVGSLKYFDLIYVMTNGGPNVSVAGQVMGATELMATYMYKNAFVTNRMGYGSAIAMGMFLIVTTLSVVALWLMNRKEA